MVESPSEEHCGAKDFIFGAQCCAGLSNHVDHTTTTTAITNNNNNNIMNSNNNNNNNNINEYNELDRNTESKVHVYSIRDTF